MAKTRQTKEQAIQELAEGLKTAKSAVFANFQGRKDRDMNSYGRDLACQQPFTASEKIVET